MLIVVKNPPANAGDTGDVGSIPRSGNFLEEDNGKPLQCSCLEYPMDSELPSIGYQRAGRN